MIKNLTDVELAKRIVECTREHTYSTIADLAIEFSRPYNDTTLSLCLTELVSIGVLTQIGLIYALGPECGNFFESCKVTSSELTLNPDDECSRVYSYIEKNGKVSFGGIQSLLKRSHDYTRRLLNDFVECGDLVEEDGYFSFRKWENTEESSSKEQNALADDHYKKLPVEPFTIQEQINEFNIAIPEKARLAIAYGTKYPLRAGIKEGENWQKDIRKAINYYFRALTGKWISEADTSEYFKNFKDEKI